MKSSCELSQTHHAYWLAVERIHLTCPPGSSLAARPDSVALSPRQSSPPATTPSSPPATSRESPTWPTPRPIGCSRSPLTSPFPTRSRPPCSRPMTGLAASTCWSTTPAMGTAPAVEEGDDADVRTLFETHFF